MTTAEFALTMFFGAVGLICVVILLTAVAASILRREAEEMAFRREIRKAQQADEAFQRQMTNKARCQAQVDSFLGEVESYEQQIAEIGRWN